MKNLAWLLLVLLLTPVSFSRAAELEVGGWIPWWQDTKGIKSATKQIKNLDIIYPFAFEVDQNGGLIDKAGLKDSAWRSLVRTADRAGTEVIPSIMWNDGANIHRILSDKKLRAEHIEAIAKMVESGKHDGINIDYESKLAETKDYFSLFLKELKDELDDKKLTCAIEARTPPQSLYRTVPATIEYSNDYKEIAKYCDIVELMTYDQQRADLKLNDARKGEPYIPVSDPAWVEKVVQLAIKDIPADKIMLGVPTYGREWTVTVASDWFKNYKGNGAINQPEAKKIAKTNKVKEGRNAAGEASFTFFPKNSPFKILDKLPVPEGTKPGFEAAARALLFANMTKIEVPVELVWYSDATAISQKVDLANKYGLRGVAIFKIDGEEDPGIWKLF